MEAKVVVASINSYNTNSVKPLNFEAKTRSERAAEKEKAYTRYVTVSMPEDDLELIELAKKEIHRRRKEEITKRLEEEQARKAEKQHNDDIKDLRETQKIIKDLTQVDKNKNIFAGSTLQKIGKIADIAISATLSGLALHWSTGYAVKTIHKVINKPKIAKGLNNIKRPFEIVGSSVAEGAKTTWKTMAKKVKETEKGQKFLATKPMQKINKGLDDLAQAYKDFRTDVKNLTIEDVKSGVATIFGVSAGVATVVEKLDNTPQNKAQKDY